MFNSFSIGLTSITGLFIFVHRPFKMVSTAAEREQETLLPASAEEKNGSGGTASTEDSGKNLFLNSPIVNVIFWEWN